MRTLDQKVLLEACIENATSKPLQLAQVKFESALGIKATLIPHPASLSKDVQDLTQPDSWLESYADGLQVRTLGGSHVLRAGLCRQRGSALTDLSHSQL